MGYTRPPLKNLPGAMTLLPQNRQRVAMALGAVVLACAVYNLFFALGGHPLYSPDEGRYARVSQVMMENGDWLVPMFEGEPRLKKPPLIHWLDGAAMAVLGSTEFAVRLPSVLATLLAAGAVYWLGSKVRDGITGLMAAVLFLACPLTVVIGRMVLIDPLLNGFWTAAMVLGYMVFADNDSIRNPKLEIHNRKFLLLFYLFVALAVFAKGPVGLIPMGIVLAWLMLCGRWKAVLHWHWLVGLIAVSLPLIGWAAAVWATHPDAVRVWYGEIVQRATGEGDHPRPVWYYLPIALVGFFPVTAMLPLPGVHASSEHISRKFRDGNVIGYLIVAAVLPLVIFSAIAGKLATYILPMGAPLALIAAWYLRKWLDVTDNMTTIKRDRAHPARRLPNGLPTIAAALLIGLGGCFVVLMLPAVRAKLPLDHDMLPGLMKVVLQAMIVPAGLIVAAVLFGRGRRRVWAMIVAGAAMVVAINIALNVESAMMNRHDGTVPQLLTWIGEQTGGKPATIHTLGFRDPTFSFYADRDILRLDAVEQAMQNGSAIPPPEVAMNAPWFIVADPKTWAQVEKSLPDFAREFVMLKEWRQPFEKWLILRKKGLGAGD